MEAFQRFIQLLHTHAHSSFWYCAMEKKHDDPNNKIKLSELELQEKEAVHNFSLRARSGLTAGEYEDLMIECGLVKKFVKGGSYELRIVLDKWKETLLNCDGAEIEKFGVKGYKGQRYFVRIGPKHDNYPRTPNVQVKNQILNPP